MLQRLDKEIQPKPTINTASSYHLFCFIPILGWFQNDAIGFQFFCP